MASTKLTPVQRLLESKRKLLKRYAAEDRQIRADADRLLRRVEQKRLMTQALITVLEKGQR